jgi:hypothetical protein
MTGAMTACRKPQVNRGISGKVRTIHLFKPLRVLAKRAR